MSTLTFAAHVITGAGRGKGLGVPTLNLDLSEVPDSLEDGVYACRVDGLPASMHIGPRPTFNDSRSCEVHLIEKAVPVPPDRVMVEVVERLRGISKFPSAEALTAQMLDDIRRSKDILGA